MPVKISAGAVRAAYARANRQGHLPVEVWLIIVSFIPYHDRPQAWFLLRSLCKASKQAVEDIYMRFYLPQLKVIAVGHSLWPCTAYRYDGLTDQGSTRFVAFASDLRMENYRPFCGPGPNGLRWYDRYRGDRDYVEVKMPNDGRRFIADIPPLRASGRHCVPDKLPWTSVLSTLFRSETTVHLHETTIAVVCFHLEEHESDRLWSRAVKGSISPFVPPDRDAVLLHRQRQLHKYGLWALTWLNKDNSMRYKWHKSTLGAD